MNLFTYTGRSAEGEAVAGALRAESAGAAIVDLRRRAILVTSVKVAKPHSSGSFGGARRRALHEFFRAFCVLSRAGIPIRRALVVAKEQCNDREMKEALGSIIADVEHGSGFSSALDRRPRNFPPLYAAMVAAGEAGGVLDAVLERIVGALDRDHALRRRIGSALVYPAVVGCAAFGLIGFLVVHVVPMFAALLAGYGTALPWPTKAVLYVSGVLHQRTTYAIAAACLCAASVTLCAARDRALMVDRLRFAVPVAGRIMRSATVSRIARVLGLLLHAGVPIVPAIEVVAPAAGSSVYARALGSVSQALHRGESLGAAVARTAIASPLVLSLIAVGEESGRLDAMLLMTADYLDVEIEAAITALSAAVEPVLLGILGVVVGFIVFSIFLPLYAVMGSLS